MTSMETWATAALCAGALGWVGPLVIARLPASADAGPETPTYPDIARAPRLSLWLAVVAIVLMTVVAFAVPTILLPGWVVVCGVGTWLAYVDSRTRLLPTRIVWPLYGAALVVVAAESWFEADGRILLRAVVASLLTFSVFWLFWWVGNARNAGAFGYGDVRFSAPLGLVLGSVGGWAVPVGLYLGILIGGVMGLIWKARGRHDAFAFGPWMLLGAVLGPVVV